MSTLKTRLHPSNNCVEDLDHLIDLHDINREIFNLMILAYHNTASNINEIHFEDITVAAIKAELRDGSKYKDCTTHHVRLIENGNTITFRVISSGSPSDNKEAIDFDATYPIALFIALMDNFFPDSTNDNTNIAFTQAKSISYKGKVSNVIAFTFKGNQDTYYFDYSQDPPTKRFP